MQFAFVNQRKRGQNIPPAYRVITRSLEDESAMHPPAWRFSLPDTVVNQQCSGITEGEGCEDRDKGLLAERLG